MDDLFKTMFGEEEQPPELESDVYPQFRSERGTWYVKEEEAKPEREATEVEAHLCMELQFFQQPMAHSDMRQGCRECGNNFHKKIAGLQNELYQIELQKLADAAQDEDQRSEDLP